MCLCVFCLSQELLIPNKYIPYRTSPSTSNMDKPKLTRLPQTPFVQTTTYTVLAPVLVAAGNYLLIGRLIRAVLPAGHHTIYHVPASRLTRVFVGCDVVSFCIQGTGSGVASGGGWAGPLGGAGVKVLIAGLVVQVCCFGAYLCVLARFHVLARRMAREDAPARWRRVLGAVYCSSGLMLVSARLLCPVLLAGSFRVCWKSQMMLTTPRPDAGTTAAFEL
ncbi:Putative RTA-like protein [Colletotrichum destructivum]|uniref:RTA-like protein n=1 Tax=Colletotrichum destructivum TaxID=34406 RepID=A0AAX4IKU7_9PEZI|nr:Putative RTA-like protein [Colletotrichum destructivum]